MKSVSIIGVGRVGGALALALDKKGYLIENLIARNPKNAENIAKLLTSQPKICKLSEVAEFTSEIIFITTQDSEIEKVVDKLVKKKIAHQKTSIFHTSGSLSSQVLAKIKRENNQIGSIHPLVSISDSVLGVKRFKDAFFCVEGESQNSVGMARQIVTDLGGRSFDIDSNYKSLYHASAVMACGHLVALLDASMEMLQRCGLDEDNSKEILMPLIKSTIDNLSNQKNSEALTGTFARADVETFLRHLETLTENTDRDILEIYLNLGERSLKLAKDEGIEPKKINEISEKISLAKKNLKC